MVLLSTSPPTPRDLVVCCTCVDVHYETVRPNLAVGRMVYSEWPLAQDLEHVSDLAQLAREKNMRTLVGVQGCFTPLVQRLKGLLEEGRIGKVLSVEVRAAGGTNDREILPTSLEYFTKRAVGGNIFTIRFGHCKWTSG
jgi:predicted dehydrogenase